MGEADGSSAMALEVAASAASGRAAPVRVTPLARRIARACGLGLEGVVGSGAGGRVMAADVRALLRAPALSSAARPSRACSLPASPPPGIPLMTLTYEVDVTSALARGVGLAAVVTAEAGSLLRAHPELNGAWGDEQLVLWRRVHIAVGEAGPEGLRWALVRDAGDLLPRGVARALGAGGGGGEATFGVVCQGAGAGWQSALPPLPGTAATLSVGAPARRLVAWGGGLAVRPVAMLTLSYDARVLDQTRAAAFMGGLRRALER